jgi:trans-aconitate methyltransferase
MQSRTTEAGAWTASVQDYVNATQAPADVLRHELLLPAFLSFLGDVRGRAVLDVGCGDGTLLGRLRQLGADVAGIDSSPEMLHIARSVLPDVPLYCHDCTRPVPELLAGRFDGITANMVFHCVRDWGTVPGHLVRCLEPGGWLAFSILHPAFHQSPEQIAALKALTPRHSVWSFPVEAPYLQERAYEKTVANSAVTVTNWHRPISDYVRALVGAGLLIEAVDEPLLSAEAAQGAQFHASLLPRFLFVRAVRAGSRRG